MSHGIMLVTIPDSWRVKDFSALPMLRNYDISEVSLQMVTRLLPYQAISENDAPELEAVKEIYDAVLEFLYGLYDEYSSEHNNIIESLYAPSENE